MRHSFEGFGVPASDSPYLIREASCETILARIADLLELPNKAIVEGIKALVSDLENIVENTPLSASFGIKDIKDITDRIEQLKGMAEAYKAE